MILNHKRKTLLDIDLSIWAQVKYFATIRKMSVNDTVRHLLQVGLSKYGYSPLREGKPDQKVGLKDK